MRFRFLALPVLCAAGALALQDSLASLQLTRETFERIVTGYVQNATHGLDREPNAPSIGRNAVQAFYALPEGSRAAVVKELGLAAKTLVMSPAFASAYESYIKGSHRAVNHGLKAAADPAEAINAAAKAGNFDAVEAASNKMMRDNYRKGVQQRLASIAGYDKATIDIMADTDVSMMDMAMPATAAEKARVAKAKAMLGEAKKQAASDLGRARATYKTALMMSAGIESEAQAAAGEDADKKLEEQRNYDRLLFKPNLKKKLQQFVAVAKTVDFAAPTQMKNGRKVFVSPANERRSELWKMLYRLGPSGTNAALSVAQAWASEL
ncbi:MAG TPA: hypothetical protein DEH78_29570 [Solibacterales bacterium]|nr:hypothetical protein [Bryobacterales bacterium]